MNLPLQIAYRNVRHSAAIETLVRQRAEKLDTFLGRIMACRVMLEAPHRHHRHGRDYHCRIDLTVPGGEVVVARDPPASATNEDLYAAVDAAFDVAQRRLEDFTRRARGDVKTHETQPHGRVMRMSKSKGYGFIESPEGHEV
ncbi:MAG: HPF/RaiA family ribosome-associated protein, partial [Deltaproteobacteria bacterium]